MSPLSDGKVIPVLMSDFHFAPRCESARLRIGDEMEISEGFPHLQHFKQESDYNHISFFYCRWLKRSIQVIGLKECGSDGF